MAGRDCDDPRNAGRKASRTRASLRVRLRVDKGDKGDKGDRPAPAPPEEEPGFVRAASGEWVVTRDVSLGGAFLSVPEVCPLGTRLRLTIELGAGKPVEVEAEVVRRSPAGSTEPGVGVRFVKISASDRLRLLSVDETSGGHPRAPTLALALGPDD